MITSIEDYLAQLRAQLAGADPAVVQDALYDAEEYLRNETAAQTADPAAALAAAIEAYGTPDEVAAAYLDTEATVANALRRPEPRPDRPAIARFFGVVADPAAYGALFYMLVSLAAGIIYFTIAVTGVSLSLSLMILIVGVPVALLFLAVVRAVSFAEGRMLEALLGVRMPRRPRVVAQTGNVAERVKAWLTDYRTWTTILYMVLMLPLGILYFTLVVTGIALAGSLVVAPIAQLITGMALISNGSDTYLIAPWFMPVMMAGGVLTFILTLHAAKLIGRAHAAFAKVMLVGRTDLPQAPTTAVAPTA